MVTHLAGVLTRGQRHGDNCCVVKTAKRCGNREVVGRVGECALRQQPECVWPKSRGQERGIGKVLKVRGGRRSLKRWRKQWLHRIVSCDPKTRHILTEGFDKEGVMGVRMCAAAGVWRAAQPSSLGL